MSERPLFVTRKFPPAVGGMETLAAGVWRVVSSAWPDAGLIANGMGNRHLPWWLPVAVVRTLWLVVTRQVGFVLTGDALMFAVLAPALRVLRVPHATMVMGLDLTFENSAYRAVVHPMLRKAPSVIAISEATAQAARSFGVPAAQVHVARLGVPVPDVSAADRAASRRSLAKLVGAGEDALLLLTLGRLVRRKGARWLVENVLPLLEEHVHYVIAGDGPESVPLSTAAEAAGVGHRVHLLGAVSDEVREIAMRGADIFVQPNIRVPGDMEGFGLVTIEAALRGTPVVAAALEGILDAVVDGETGILLPPEDPQAWASRLEELSRDREALIKTGQVFRDAAIGRYGEDAMRARLVELLTAAAHP